MSNLSLGYQYVSKCHWHDFVCPNHWHCMECEHQPLDVDKKNGKNPPMECVGMECPACGEPTYRDAVCIFCGQRFFKKKKGITT